MALTRQSVTGTGTVTINVNQGEYIRMSLTGDTLLQFTGLPTTGLVTLEFLAIQDSTGDRSVSIAAQYNEDGETTVFVSPIPNKRSRFDVKIDCDETPAEITVLVRTAGEEAV